MAERPFDVEIDRATRTITIQGIRYSFELFDALGFAAEGKAFRIGERTDGAVTLHELTLP